MTNEQFQSMTPLEQSTFIGRIAIAAQTDYFLECKEIIERAEHDGLFKSVDVSFESHPQISDLDNPIEQ